MTHFIGANITQTYTTAQLAFGNAPKPGDVFEAANGNRYKFVKHDTAVGAVASVAGKGAYMFATSAASTGATNTVTMDLTDALPGNLMGVFQSVIPNGDYGWIQTWGLCTLNTTLSSGADGCPIGPGAADGALSHVETTSSATAAKAQFGFSIDASAKIVFLKCV